MFDVITPAMVAADLTISMLLEGPRAARLVEQHAIDPTLPGLDDVIGALVDATFKATTATPTRRRSPGRRSACWSRT